jgi:hypothetical protein
MEMCERCGKSIMFECECPDVCEHGSEAVDGGSNPGFTGAPIYWTNYADGCQWFDGSADNLEAAR